MIHIKFLKQRWLYGLLDFIGVLFSTFIAIHLKVSLATYSIYVTSTFNPNLTWPKLTPYALALAGFFVIIQYVLGKYDVWSSASLLIWIKRLILPNLLLVAIVFSYLFLNQKFDFPRSLVFILGTCNLLFGLVWRISYFNKKNHAISDVLLIGGLKQLLPLAEQLLHPPFNTTVRIKALFSDEQQFPLKPTEYQREPLSDDKIKWSNTKIHPMHEFFGYCQKNDYNSIIIDPTELNQTTLLTTILEAVKPETSVFVLPSPYEILLGRLEHVQINDLPLIELKLRNPSTFLHFSKRLFDFILALILLTILAIPGLIVALIIKLSSSGSIFYSQERVGLNGKIFNIYKFRSMVDNAEQNTGAVLATKMDPRITKFGNIMRKTRLDEIPQLINVLRGDMSFIGPRPERPIFVTQYEKDIPAYVERKRIRPGITGLAQVSGNYETIADIKLKYDLAYMVNQNLLLDLQILGRTIKSVFTRAGQ